MTIHRLGQLYTIMVKHLVQAQIRKIYTKQSKKATLLPQSLVYMIKRRLDSITILSWVRLTLSTRCDGMRRPLHKRNRRIVTTRVEIHLLRIEILPVTRHTHSKNGNTDTRHRRNRRCLAGRPVDARESIGVVGKVVRDPDSQCLQEAADGCLDGALVEGRSEGADGGRHADGMHYLLGACAVLVQKGPGVCGVCEEPYVLSKKLVVHADVVGIGDG